MTEWREIWGFPGQYVSRDGQVRRGDKLLKASLNQAGYPVVMLTVGVGYRKLCRVHRLVAQAFIPNPLNLPEVNHMHPDGDKTRNNDWNLEWTTRKGNAVHATHVLKKQVGQGHSQAKLTNAQVAEIRQKLATGCKGQRLAEQYGVSPATISQIRTGKTRWRELE